MRQHRRDLPALPAGDADAGRDAPVRPRRRRPVRQQQQTLRPAPGTGAERIGRAQGGKQREEVLALQVVRHPRRLGQGGHEGSRAAKRRRRVEQRPGREGLGKVSDTAGRAEAGGRGGSGEGVARHHDRPLGHRRGQHRLGLWLKVPSARVQHDHHSSITAQHGPAGVRKGRRAAEPVVRDQAAKGLGLHRRQGCRRCRSHQRRAVPPGEGGWREGQNIEAWQKVRPVDRQFWPEGRQVRPARQKLGRWGNRQQVSGMLRSRHRVFALHGMVQ